MFYQHLSAPGCMLKCHLVLKWFLQNRDAAESHLFFFSFPRSSFFWGCWYTSSISRHMKQLNMLTCYEPGWWGRMRWERDMMRSVIPVQGCKQHAVLPGAHRHTQPASVVHLSASWLAAPVDGWLQQQEVTEVTVTAGLPVPQASFLPAELRGQFI